MRITIDAAGRLVIPKALRDAAGLRPGTPLDVRLHDGRIEMEVAPMPVRLVEKHGILLAEASEDSSRNTDKLTADSVKTTLERLRSERG